MQDKDLRENQIIAIRDKCEINLEFKRITGHCDICHKMESINYDSLDTLSRFGKHDLATKLYSQNWRIANDSLYCPNCYEQMNTLLTISKNNMRPDKHQYYLNIAKEVLTRSTCLRKKYGAIIVKNDTIISTGYNGSPRGTANCIDLCECRREKLNIPRGERYEICRALHAEQNCIINASRNDMIDSTLYLYGIDVSDNGIVYNLDSCQMCKKMIINAGITTVVFARPNNQYEICNVDTWKINDETLTNKLGY